MITQGFAHRHRSWVRRQGPRKDRSGRTEEKDITLAAAAKLAKRLQVEGLEVFDALR